MSMQKESPLVRLRIFYQSHAWLPLLHLLIHISPPVTGQPVTPVEPDSNKSVVTIMAIVAAMFLISAVLSLYSRKCSDRQSQTRGNRLDLAAPTGAGGNPSNAESNGLDQATIETFPTFLYSDVKGLKIGNDTLACAVCLNEFQDEETLRMIPKCCHVYHSDCIDVWLASHSTCPVCRANLVPQPEDINMPPMVRSLHQSRPSLSRSTGFLSSLLFPRSNSLGQLVQPGENYERFTLRLPEEVRSQMMNSTLKRAKSCVCFTRMSSDTRGYRTRSVGSGRGRGCVQYERFGGEVQWGFPLTPPSLVRNNGWNRSMKKSQVQRSGVAFDNNLAGERSSDFLRLAP
uniref:RING-type E3 ubiquitin transferase n=1 Tax=Cajanus cajan TaxID=3821 RepID=A0A151R8B6_CAJCA|nr:RING-H2 finger protein ATL1N [Cajanus cajan]